MKKYLILLGLFIILPQTVLAASHKPVAKPTIEPVAKPAAEAVIPDEGLIHSFDVQAELNADRTLKITEKIDYDFGTNEKHGIYRNIPETYIRDGMTYSLSYDIG